MESWPTFRFCAFFWSPFNSSPSPGLQPHGKSLGAKCLKLTLSNIVIITKNYWEAYSICSWLFACVLKDRLTMEKEIKKLRWLIMILWRYYNKQHTIVCWTMKLFTHKHDTLRNYQAMNNYQTRKKLLWSIMNFQSVLTPKLCNNEYNYNEMWNVDELLKYHLYIY